MNFPIQPMTPTHSFRVTLRRYARDTEQRHEARVIIGTEDRPDYQWDGEYNSVPAELDLSDPRWPTHAGDGYEFKSTDAWQRGSERLYRLPDGSPTTWDEAPVGACFEAQRGCAAHLHHFHQASTEYLTQHAQQRGVYLIRLPNQVWFSPDHIASSGDGKSGWTVRGDPTNLVVTPSVWSNAPHGPPDGWHGWIGCNGAEPGHLTPHL